MRNRPRPSFTRTQTLTPVLTLCPVCQHRLYADYANVRTVTTLAGVTRLILYILYAATTIIAAARATNPIDPRPESHFALPHHEFGLDVIACVRTLTLRRTPQHPRDPPRTHSPRRRPRPTLRPQSPGAALRTNCAPLAAADPQRLQRLLQEQPGVVLAIDGLQPDVGHEVLWVLRDCVSGEILLARSLLSATSADLATLLSEVREGLASAYHGRHLGRPADDPPSRGPGIAGRAASVVPLPLPA